MKATASIALALMVTGLGARADESAALRMGVRADARPFVFLQPDGITYGGFLFDLCVAAAKSAGRDAIELVLITAKTRLVPGDQDTAPLDVICDPTTITMDRAGEWDFTPIVFVANSTFMRRDRSRPVLPSEAPPNCAEGSAEEFLLAGFVAGTTAQQAIAQAVADQSLQAAVGQTVCPVEFASHDVGVREFCRPDGLLTFYFGDADIISAQVEAVRGRGDICAAKFDTGFFRFEPYAIIVNDRDPGFRRRFIQGVYAFFGGDAAGASFAENFPDRKRSPALEFLFGLYRLPDSDADAEQQAND